MSAVHQKYAKSNRIDKIREIIKANLEHESRRIQKAELFDKIVEVVSSSTDDDAMKIAQILLIVEKCE